MISFDGDYWNSGGTHAFEALDGVVHRLRRHGAFVKEIAAHYHKIDPLTDRVTFQHIDPRIIKIPRTLGQLVPRTPKMHIGNVEELHRPDFTTEHTEITEKAEMDQPGFYLSVPAVLSVVNSPYE